MNIRLLTRLLTVLVFTFLLTNSCKKEEDETTVGTVKDIDGNIYITVKIGNQWWMTENLKTTRFSNGEAIPDIKDTAQWRNLTSSAYCNYFDDDSVANMYGRLYNWYASVDNRKLCPTGWHVSTDEDWTSLTNFLGGENLAGGKLKDTGTTYWTPDNIGATNQVGFEARGGGYRLNTDAIFYELGQTGLWWSTAKDDTIITKLPCDRTILKYYPNINRGGFARGVGISVRCVKDK